MARDRNLGVIHIEVVGRTNMNSLMLKESRERRRQWTEDKVLGNSRQKWKDG